MKLKRSEHSRFVQWLDRTAEKNPFLWLPCVLLIALMLTAEHIAEYAKIARLHRNTEKIVKDRPQFERKPFALRVVAVTVTAAFSLMLVPVNSFAAFDEEYDTITEQVVLDEVSETEGTSDLEETTEPEEPIVTEVTTAPETEETPVTEVTTAPEETVDPEETTVTEVTTAPEESADPEDAADPDEAPDPAETTAPEETTTPEETTEPEEPEYEDFLDENIHTNIEVRYDEYGHEYQYCTVCGRATAPRHEYEWWNEDNGSGHYRFCVVCREKTDFGGHSYNYEYDSYGHRGECVCGTYDSGSHVFSEGVITVGQDGKTPVRRHFCVSCGYFYDVPVDHTHIVEDDWSSDAFNHWNYCMVCKNEIDRAAHDYIVKVTLEPTDTTKGTRVYTCTVCGYSYDEAIPELGHVHDFITGWNINETSHWHECVCGEKTDSASHVSDGGTVTVQPTSASAGVKSYTCTICGYIIKTESIPALSTAPNVPDTVYYPSVAVTEASQRLPYVTNSPEVKGWQNIAAYINASADEVIIPITMNGENEMPKEIAECIMNRNVTLTINMGGGSVWTVNGLDVISPRTVNMRVSEQSNKIPSKVIDNLISEFEPKEYRLYHSGDFGFAAELTLNVGHRYNDYYATLYHYNSGAKQLEFVDERLVENKYVTFSLTHASYYVVAFNSIPMYDDVSASAGIFENSIPIEASAMPETNGVTVPAVKLPQIMKYSNKKRRYRILRKRRLDDLVFVL